MFYSAKIFKRKDGIILERNVYEITLANHRPF